MENTIMMREVYEVQELKSLEGCVITSVTGPYKEGDEGVCIDCRDKDENLVSFIVLGDGSWHLHNGKKKSVTAEQIGEISLLAGCSDIDSVHFHNVDPIIEAVIKVNSLNSADRVLTMLKESFPTMGAIEDKWEFEGKLQPMFQCNALDYDLMIVVAVMTKKSEVTQ